MKAQVDARMTIHGWEVVAWRVGDRPWAKRNGLEPVSDVFLAETFRPGFTLSSSSRRLISVRKTGYWHEGIAFASAVLVRVEVDYPMPIHRTGDSLGNRCQAKWNDRTNTLTGCERPAIGRFIVSDAGLKRRKVRLCARCMRLVRPI